VLPIVLMLTTVSCTMKASSQRIMQITDGQTMGTISMSEETSGAYRINIRQKMCLVESPTDYQEQELFISGKRHSMGWWATLYGLFRLINEL
jgi:hypothetical protein